MTRTSSVIALALVLATSGSTAPRGAGNEAAGEWPSYAATNAGTKYSPLDQINADTIDDVRIAWRQSAIPVAMRENPYVRVPNNHQNTPLMVGGLLYISSGLGIAAALDATTGKVVWFDQPPGQPVPAGEPPVGRDELLAGNGPGKRGVAYWTDGRDARVLATTGNYLVALNARTGKRYAEFGEGGHVDLRKGLDNRVESHTGGSSPIVVGDVVIVGGQGSRPGVPAGIGDVRGYDVRTGKQLWTFHTIPRTGEYGNDTWLKDSWAVSGATAIWGFLSADDELGYVYLPIESPTAVDRQNNFYGGRRPGANLFGNSLVCLDAKTGKRIWHYQIIHHDIWDWDLNAPPILLDITVDGRRIKAVAQPTKHAFLFVFDRVTGQPVWPIEERPVPQGDVPGEWYSPTQPFPTKPPPFDQQDMTDEYLIDFTPELRREALAIVNQYRRGPLFDPPSVAGGPDGKKGTILSHTVTTTWTGGAADPETGIVYIPSVHNPLIATLVKPNHPLAYDKQSKSEWTHTRGQPNLGPWIEGPQGLPDPFKPPYGRLTAIDLNKGDIVWMMANGDGPRNHPALKHLNLPPLGQAGRASPLVTKSLVFLGEGGNAVGRAVLPGGGGKMFRAYDKATGKVVWEVELPGGTTSSPMTYMANGKQYIVVAVGWTDTASEYIALAIP
jgi:quinoprotein glucose dehydrogenase